jgi:hypothetical protein
VTFSLLTVANVTSPSRYMCLSTESVSQIMCESNDDIVSNGEKRRKKSSKGKRL